MKNYIQPGGTLTVTAPAAVTSGSPVVIGSIIGIAATDAASGDPVEVDIEGVFELVKITSDALAVGDKLFWDSAVSKVTKTPGTGSKPLVGYATIAAGNGVTKVNVRLLPTMQTGPA